MAIIPDLGNVGPLVDQTPTLMQQASQNRRQDELMRMQQVEFAIKRPVMEAQARAQLASEALDLTATHIVANSVAADAQRFPEYVKAWVDSAQIEDPKARLTERRRILGAISPLAAVKNIKPMVETFRQQFAEDAMADKTADLLASREAINAAGNETKLLQKEKDVEAKRIQLDAQRQQFEMRQQQAKELEQIKATHAQELEKTRGENRLNAVKAGTEGKQATAKEVAANKINDTALQEAQTATVELRDYNQALQLLNDPSIRTGTGADFEAAASRLGGIFGADTTKAKNIEQLQSLLGTTFTSRIGAFKGNFSDKDALVLRQITPNVGRTNEGNIAMLNFLIQKRQRDLEIGALVNEARKVGDTEREIQAEVFDYVQSHPLEVNANAAAPAGGLTPQEQTRLQELRSKLGK